MKPNVQDDSLPHQMRLIFRTPTAHSALKIAVSCNCLLQTDHIGGRGNRPYYKEMGYAKDARESLAMYNDPANHNTRRYSFPYEGPAEADSQREGTVTVLGQLDGGDLAWSDPPRLEG